MKTINKIKNLLKSDYLDEFLLFNIPSLLTSTSITFVTLKFQHPALFLLTLVVYSLSLFGLKCSIHLLKFYAPKEETK